LVVLSLFHKIYARSLVRAVNGKAKRERPSETEKEKAYEPLAGFLFLDSSSDNTRDDSSSISILREIGCLLSCGYPTRGRASERKEKARKEMENEEVNFLSSFAFS